MTYTLAIGDRTYSSWSLRGWLIFAGFDIPVTLRYAVMRTPAFPDMLADFGPSRTVPTLRIDDSDGTRIVWDSLAIAMAVAERNPEVAFWPEAAKARAQAMSMTAEMHSGFTALRGACPMNLHHVWDGFAPGEDVQADLDRIATLWSQALETSGGPWLFGAFTLADAFFAPVAMRIAGYGLAVPAAAEAYVKTHLAALPFRRWRAEGQADREHQAVYDMDLPTLPWPGPRPVAAEAVTGLEAINTVCPYSAKPVAADSLARIDGRVIGFCNPRCRDKTVADPEAWPAAMALVR